MSEPLAFHALGKRLRPLYMLLHACGAECALTLPAERALAAALPKDKDLGQLTVDQLLSLVQQARDQLAPQPFKATA